MECFSVRVSGCPHGRRKHELPHLLLQLMMIREIPFFLKWLCPDSYLSEHDLSCVAWKVQTVERELSLEGLSFQSYRGVNCSGSTWSTLIAL